MFCGWVRCGLRVDVGVASDTTGCSLPRPYALAYICMSAQNTARPAHRELPACGQSTLMRLRPPLSMGICRAAPSLG